MIGSAQSSVEEQFFHRQIADSCQASVSLVSYNDAGDGILLSEDRTPNLRGAFLNGLIDQLPDSDLSSVAAKISSGAIDTLFVIDQDVTDLGISAELLSKVKIVYFGTLANRTSQVADVVCPTLSVFEKDGTFVNQSFRLQKFNAAVPGPRGVQADILALEEILAYLNDETPKRPAIMSVWEQIAATTPSFSGLSWQTIGDEGVELDPTSFLDVPFVETKNLKFDPAALKETHLAAAGV